MVVNLAIVDGTQLVALYGSLPRGMPRGRHQPDPLALLFLFSSFQGSGQLLFIISGRFQGEWGSFQ